MTFTCRCVIMKKEVIAMHTVFESAVYIKAQEKPSEFSLYDPIPLFRRELEITE